MGTCTLDFNDPGNTDYVPATQAVQVVSVGQGANSITVTSTDTSATVGSTYVPTATATSGDTVVITVDSSSSGVCSISAGTVTFNHVGTCTLDFNDPGNTDYVPATQAVQVVSVGQGANSITVTSTDTSATVGSTYVPTATATSGDTVVITVDSSSSGVCSISAGTVTFNHVGTCTLDFNDPGNTDYVPATQAVQVVSVGQGANSITVTSTDTSATVGSTYVPTATATSGDTVVITVDSSSSGVCSISAGTVTFNHVGTCTLDFNDPGNTDYVPATQAVQSFTVTANTYTVAFSANGGSGTMSSETFTGNTGQALTTNTFTRAGFTFAGWATSPSGGVVYFDGQTISVSASETLYAVWTPVVSTVAFSANGGSGTMSSETFTGNTGQALTTNTFTRAGFTFAGWATSPSGGVVYFDGQTISVSASETLYAVWTPVVSTVAFSANGGSGTMSSETFTGNTGQALTTNTFTRAGFTFAGWATSPSGGVVYFDGQTISVSASETLYAVWTPVVSTVAFSANGGSGTMSSETFTGNTGQALTTNTFTRAGFTFAGWATSPSGGVVYFDGQTISVSASETLYAVWTPATLLANTIAFGAAPTGVTFGEAPGTHSVHATATSGTISYTSLTPLVCTVNATTGALTITGSGLL